MIPLKHINASLLPGSEDIRIMFVKLGRPEQ